MITAEQLAAAILDLKEAQKETDKQVKEISKAQKETDKQIKETSKAIKETDKQMRETDKVINRIEQQMDMRDRKLDKVAKLVGNIANNQGDIAEEFFYNSLKSKPSLAGLNYDFIDKNVTRRRNGVEDEYDILLVNGKDVAIIETKYKAHEKDVDKLLHKKYENFKKLYPEYANYNHHLGLATFYLNEDVKNKALENSVILLQRKGDLVETILPNDNY